MANDKKTYAEHFTPESTATYKERKIAELTHDALDHLSKAFYLEHAREDILSTLKKTVDEAEPIQKEFDDLKDKTERTARERRKELQKKLIPFVKRIKDLTNDAEQFKQQAEALRIQATERIYRRDFIIQNFPEKMLGMEALDPHMAADKNTL